MVAGVWYFLAAIELVMKALARADNCRRYSIIYRFVCGQWQLPEIGSFKDLRGKFMQEIHYA